MPDTAWLAPMLCRTARCWPADLRGWVLEPKWDGYRMLCHRDERGRFCFYTRHGRAYRTQLPYLAEELDGRLPPGSVLDGELVCLLGDGPRVVQARGRIAGALSRTVHQPSVRHPALHLVVFDVLTLGGEDLRARPWHARRAHLTELLPEERGQVRAVSVHEPSVALHEHLLDLGFEGSILKRADARYRSGRRADCWTKWRGPLAGTRQQAA